MIAVERSRLLANTPLMPEALYLIFICAIVLVDQHQAKKLKAELMQKALVAGMPLLAAVSAPSSLAVKLAREFDVTLVGFLRGESYNVYSGSERILRP